MLLTREAGPFALRNELDSRRGGVFDEIEAVFPEAERDALMLAYKTAAGYAIEKLNSAPPTLADIGAYLGLSETKVKRLFAIRSFMLQRIESICAMINMDLGDLFGLLESERERITRLTRQQKQKLELVADVTLLLVAVSMRNHLNFDEITCLYRLSESETVRHLAHLDRLGIIELLPDNRIKLLIDENFEWMPNGPIQRFYRQHMQAQFLDARFAAEVEMCAAFNMPSSVESVSRAFVRKLRDLAREFTELDRADRHLPPNQRYSM